MWSAVWHHLAGKGDNVGGVWEVAGGGYMGRGVDRVCGGASIGSGGCDVPPRCKPGAVDTVHSVPFAVSLIQKIGAFDETLLANEDYEFNTRVREAGGVVWLDPSIRCVYFSRST